MELRRPTLADKETILSMVAEFEETQSAHDGGFWDAEAFVYEAWLESNRDMEMGLGIPEGWVPAVQLVAFARDGQAVGFLNLRSERGKGYAKEALHQGLQVAKEKNIHRALVTCSTENPASRAVILANGGQFEDVRNGTERYWIEVD